MLAALPDRRHAGVGYTLKLAQRASCLDRGIHLVRWTFDPLVARNAHLNVNKLGATCDRFHRDYYGRMPDTINAGDRSDRLVVRWPLDATPSAPAVPEGAEGDPAQYGSVDAPVPEVVGDPHPGRGGRRPDPARPRGSAVRRPGAPDRAWRDAVGAILEACLAADWRSSAPSTPTARVGAPRTCSPNGGRPA